MKRKILGIFLTLSMVFTMLPGMTIEPYAMAHNLYYKIDGATLHINALEAESYIPFDTSHEPPWQNKEVKNKIEEIIIDNIIYTSTISYWFCSGKQGESDSNIQSISGLENIDMNKVENADYAFAGLKNTAVNLEKINLCNVRSAKGMFKNSSFDSTFINETIATASHNLIDAAYMFSGCKNLTTFKFPANFMPSNCQELLSHSCVKTVDVSEWTPANGSNIKGLFEDCSKLSKITARINTNWSDTTYCDGTNMFNGCNMLLGGEGTEYSAANTGLEFARIDKAKSEGSSGAGYFTDVDENETTIIPKDEVTVPKTSIKSLKAGKKSFTVKVKKIAGAEKYQVRYSLKKSMKGAVKKSFTLGKVSKTVKKLKAKKTYYIQVRTLKKIEGKTYYSSWSKAKKIKTK